MARCRTVLKIAEQETAVRRWVAEAGRELREVEAQISFFRRRVEARIHREEPPRGPVEKHGSET